MAETLKDKPDSPGPQPGASDEILNDTWPIPPEEIERFVALIYEDRRRAAEASPAEPLLFE